MRGAAPMNVGRMTARFSMILSTRPSTAVEYPTCNCMVSSTLPKEWAIGSHRYWMSSTLSSPVAATAAPS